MGALWYLGNFFIDEIKFAQNPLVEIEEKQWSNPNNQLNPDPKTPNFSTFGEVQEKQMFESDFILEKKSMSNKTGSTEKSSSIKDINIPDLDNSFPPGKSGIEPISTKNLSNKSLFLETQLPEENLIFRFYIPTESQNAQFQSNEQYRNPKRKNKFQFKFFPHYITGIYSPNINDDYFVEDMTIESNLKSRLGLSFDVGIRKELNNALGIEYFIGYNSFGNVLSYSNTLASVEYLSTRSYQKLDIRAHQAIIGFKRWNRSNAFSLKYPLIFTVNYGRNFGSDMENITKHYGQNLFIVGTESNMKFLINYR